MIGIIIAVIVAALVFWIATALGLPVIVAAIAALLVLLGGVGGPYWHSHRGPGPY